MLFLIIAKKLEEHIFQLKTLLKIQEILIKVALIGMKESSAEDVCLHYCSDSKSHVEQSTRNSINF